VAAKHRLRLDVTSEADWQAAMARILSQWGRLDICVNCAGISFAKPIAELNLADWRRVMATNLDSVFLGTRQAMIAMKEHGGCIINIASAAGIKPISGNAAYGTSKAAIRFFTRVAALEGKPHHPGQFNLARCRGDADVGIHGHVAQAGRRNRWAGRGLEGIGGTDRASPSRRKSRRRCFFSPAMTPGT
jgi:NAD(P)-dependent dehydrogenase (short-subunit alcohol dehydrogenase family)